MSSRSVDSGLAHSGSGAGASTARVARDRGRELGLGRKVDARDRRSFDADAEERERNVDPPRAAERRSPVHEHDTAACEADVPAVDVVVDELVSLEDDAGLGPINVPMLASSHSREQSPRSRNGSGSVATRSQRDRHGPCAGSSGGGVVAATSSRASNSGPTSSG